MSTFSERTAEKIARSRAVHVALKSESRRLREARASVLLSEAEPAPTVDERKEDDGTDD